jgi:hypothetical protein
MTQPRFLGDHDLNEQIIVGVLRRAPQAVFLRMREVGLAEQPDPVIMDYAAGQGLIIVSHNVNTMPATAYTRMAEGHRIAGLLMVPQTASMVDKRCRGMGKSGRLSAFRLALVRSDGGLGG